MLTQNYSKENSVSLYQGRFSYWKASLLAFLLTMASFWTGYSFSKVPVLELFSFNFKPFWSTFLALAVFLTIFLLTVFFVERKELLTIAVVLAAGAFFVPFFPFLNQKTIWGIVVTVGLFLIAAFEGRRHLDDFLRIKFFNIGNFVLSKVVLALALVAAIFSFNLLSLQSLNQRNFIFSEDFFEKTLNWSGKILEPLIGNLDFSLSLRELSLKLVDQQIKSQNLPANLVNPAVKKELVEKSIANFQKQFQSLLGVSLNPEIKLSSAIYQAFLLKINNLDEKSKTIFSMVLALLIFLTVQFLSPFIRWLVLILAFVVYQFLMIVGFGAIVFENKSKEKIILP